MEALPIIRDRSIEQVAAARAFVAALGRVGDAVRRGADIVPRDDLRTAFAALAHAGIEVDDAAHALEHAISILAMQLGHAGVVAIAAERIDPTPTTPAAILLARVQPLRELGRVALVITDPTPAVVDAAMAIRGAVPSAARRNQYDDAIRTTVLVDQVDITIIEPPPPEVLARAAAVEAEIDSRQPANDGAA